MFVTITLLLKKIDGIFMGGQCIILLKKIAEISTY